MGLNVTMLDLVTAVSEFAESDAEVVATVAHMVNSGVVRLCGNFAGRRIDLATRRGGLGVAAA
jgi:hypothetical protein